MSEPVGKRQGQAGRDCVLPHQLETRIHFDGEGDLVIVQDDGVSLPEDIESIVIRSVNVREFVRALQRIVRQARADGASL